MDLSLNLHLHYRLSKSFYMKTKFLFLLTLCAVFFACSDDDDNNNTIVGAWKSQAPVIDELNVTAQIEQQIKNDILNDSEDSYVFDKNGKFSHYLHDTFDRSGDYTLQDKILKLKSGTTELTFYNVGFTTTRLAITRNLTEEYKQYFDEGMVTKIVVTYNYIRQ